MDWPLSLHTSCSTVLTMRSGLSSRAPRRRSSSPPSASKKAWMASSREGRSISSMVAGRNLVSLMVHLTTRSYHLASCAARPASPLCAPSASARAYGVRSSSMSAVKTWVRLQFSRIFIISRLSALSSATPSCSPLSRSSTRQHSSTLMRWRSVGSRGSRASHEYWNRFISVLSAYLHARTLAEPWDTIEAPASEKMESVLAARMATRRSMLSLKAAATPVPPGDCRSMSS
mmetsp:Transcript_33188/g.84254  ORF Transcript_33188/g.84254 Transcript_33188/m.84254 type:complete len:231 (-) Transcript_33188:1945-2637(-)